MPQRRRELRHRGRGAPSVGFADSSLRFPGKWRKSFLQHDEFEIVEQSAGLRCLVIGEGASFAGRMVAAPLVEGDQLAAAGEDLHLHPGRPERVAGEAFGSGQQGLAHAAALKRGVNRQHAEINEAIALLPQQDARAQSGAIVPNQEVPDGIGEQFSQFPGIGPGAGQQVGLVAPPATRRLTAIGAFDQRMQSGNIGRGGRLQPHSAPLLVTEDRDLAAAGIGTLGIVEFDTVDLSNLQRQLLYGTDDVGKSKLAAATDRLQAINPHVCVEGHADRLSSANALELLAQYDLIVDGTDNFATRYLVNDACAILKKPNVFGSIFRFEGQLSVFCAPAGPCYRCLFPAPPPADLVPNCAEAGVLGVLPGLVGVAQATEAIKLVTGIGDPLIGRLLLMDALSMRFRTVPIRRHEACAGCGALATGQLGDYETVCGAIESSTKSTQIIQPTELAERLQRGDALEIIDVREEHEWALGHLDAARHIPLSVLLAHSTGVAHDRDVVVLCKSGGRSAQALAALQAQGHDRVWNLDGGMLRWRALIDPSVNVA